MVSDVGPREEEMDDEDGEIQRSVSFSPMKKEILLLSCLNSTQVDEPLVLSHVTLYNDENYSSTYLVSVSLSAFSYFAMLPL